MIVSENVTINNKDFTKTYSDENFYILQNETGNIYQEAIDLPTAPYTYSETDIKIEDDTTDEEYVEAAKIMLGEV